MYDPKIQIIHNSNLHDILVQEQQNLSHLILQKCSLVSRWLFVSHTDFFYLVELGSNQPFDESIVDQSDQSLWMKSYTIAWDDCLMKIRGKEGGCALKGGVFAKIR